MARAALQFSVRELAEKSSVSPETVVRFEKGEQLRPRTIDAIKQALEAAGVEFTGGSSPGVRLKGEALP